MLLVTDEAASLSFVSMAVSAICSESKAMVQWNVTVGQHASAGPCVSLAASLRVEAAARLIHAIQCFMYTFVRAQI